MVKGILLIVVFIITNGALADDGGTCEKLLIKVDSKERRPEIKTFRQIINEAEKTHQGLTESLIERFEDVGGLGKDFFKKVYLEVKRLENKHQTEYMFRRREEVPLSNKEMNYLLKGFSESNFDVANLDEDQLQQFFLNQLRRIYILAEEGYWNSKAYESLKEFGLISPKIVKGVSRSLRAYNSSLSDLTARSLDLEMAERVFSEIQEVPEKEVIAIAEAYKRFDKENMEDAKERLEKAGLSAITLDKILSFWKTSPTICCASEPGCRTCHLNRPFRR